MEDPYDLPKSLMAKEKEKSMQLRSLHDKPFNPGQIKKLLKYEFPFLGKDEVYTHSFLAADDPYAISI